MSLAPFAGHMLGRPVWRRKTIDTAIPRDILHHHGGTDCGIAGCRSSSGWVAVRWAVGFASSLRQSPGGDHLSYTRNPRFVRAEMRCNPFIGKGLCLYTGRPDPSVRGSNPFGCIAMSGGPACVCRDIRFRECLKEGAPRSYTSRKETKKRANSALIGRGRMGYRGIMDSRCTAAGYGATGRVKGFPCSSGSPSTRDT
jgi:hypothetical protein